MAIENGHSDILLAMRGLRIETAGEAGGQPILHGVDLDVRRGEVLGVIGESGAGKSTIGLAALGLTRPGCHVAGGGVSFDGIPLFGAAPAAARRLRGGRIAYVAQSAIASFNPAHRLLAQTIEGCLVHGLLSRDAAVARAKDLYAQLQLPDPAHFGDRFPHQVSGGQLQRAMIAMALMSDPDLVVFDEPTTALDVTTQIEVLRSIKSLVESRDMSAIYVTHDLALVTQVAHRILVLRYGRVVECAPTRAMLAEPKDPYTRSLWAVRQLQKSPAAPSVPLLTLSGIQAAYGDLTVLHGIDIAVQRGHTVALVGESGSGKSTIAKVVTGVMPSTSGQVLFDGTVLPPNLRHRSPGQLRRIQLVHQNPDSALNPRRTIEQSLARPLAIFQSVPRSLRRRKVTELLDLVGLPHACLFRRPGELSGGEKQRVAIARALAAKPDIIVCDEVTSALDQIVQRDILELLGRLQRQLGVTYVFITHDLATVRAIADDVVVLRRGSVVRQGKKDEVLSPPYDSYTELLIASVPEIDPDWLDRTLSKGGLPGNQGQLSLV
ncbi:ABC transporter ATP-binding protein [Bosea sp. (in: a-proteobacteria)]|jgi:peptide/nickel transport system ATP-binding protein|uniref:ABC transporter ATP-binding protein n=1 Tax=Bosea sp. (in: a-proteobacteria) TaxID=1871050 RepID=UPI003F704068